MGKVAKLASGFLLDCSTSVIVVIINVIMVIVIIIVNVIPVLVILISSK